MGRPARAHPGSRSRSHGRVAGQCPQQGKVGPAPGPERKRGPLAGAEGMVLSSTCRFLWDMLSVQEQDRGLSVRCPGPTETDPTPGAHRVS